MNNWSRYLAIVIVFLIVGTIFYFFSDIVAFVLISWVLSMMTLPIMKLYKNYLKLGNSGSAGLTLVTTIFIIGGIFWIFVPPILQQTRNLADIDYASLVKSLEEPINSLNNTLVEKGLMEGEIIKTEEEQPALDSLNIPAVIPIKKTEKENKQTIEFEVPQAKEKMITSSFIAIDSLLLENGDTLTQTNISLVISIDNNPPELTSVQPIDSTAIILKNDTPIEKIQKRIFKLFNPGRIPELFATLVGFMGNLLIGIMSILFITFFFLKEQGLFSSFLQALVPTKYEKQVLHAVDDSSIMLRRYFLGIFIQVTTITLFMWVLLTILGVQNALLIAFFAALVNVIPYVGPIIGATFGVFITISSNLDLNFYNEMLPLILTVIAAFAAMQLLDNFLLQPYIFSNSVSAHPLEIFIIIMVGAKLSGIVGMVLAIPVYTVVRVIAKAFLSEFKIVQSLTKKL